LRENLNYWKGKNKKVTNSKRNLFSQQDSEAQFINQDEDGDDDEESQEYDESASTPKEDSSVLYYDQ